MKRIDLSGDEYIIKKGEEIGTNLIFEIKSDCLKYIGVSKDYFEMIRKNYYIKRTGEEGKINEAAGKIRVNKPATTRRRQRKLKNTINEEMTSMKKKIIEANKRRKSLRKKVLKKNYKKNSTIIEIKKVNLI